MRYVVRGNDCVYGKSTETKDVAAVSKKAATESKLSLAVKRSAEDDSYETSQKSKKFRLVESREEKEEDQSYVNPPVTESLVKNTEEEHVSLDDIMHEANLIGATVTEESTILHDFSPPAPVELPLHPLHVTSSLLSAALTTAEHSEEWDEHEYDDDEVAVNFAMGLPIHNIRATDLAKLLGAYDSYDDVDDEERFGEPREDFHSYIYEMVGLDANGKEVTESGEEFDSSGDEFDSDEEDESGYSSESGDEEVDRASLISDDEEKDEWEEHEYSEAELNAEEGIAVSGDEENEETESEGEDEIKR